MSEKIAVIGGSGFLGQYVLRDAQAAGYEVVNIDAQAPATEQHLWKNVDIRDAQALAQALRGCAAVVNLAAAHRDDIRPLSLYHDINVTGAENLCQAMAQNDIKTCLFTSSVAVYGLNKGVPDEASVPQPFNPYGQTKWEAENVYASWVKKDTDRALLIVRPTVIFGPNNRGNVYNLIAQIARKRFVMIGSGKNKKSLAYVENVSAFLVYMLQQKIKPGMAIYNYVDKPDWDVKTLVMQIQKCLEQSASSLRLPYFIGYGAGAILDVLARLTGRTFPISRIRIEKFCANTVYAADKMQNTGFVPKKDMQAALIETIGHEFKHQG